MLFLSLKNSKFKTTLIILVILFAIIAALLAAGAIYRSSYDNKVHPGIKITDRSKNGASKDIINKYVGERDVNEVSSYLKEQLNSEDNKIVFEYEDDDEDYKWEYSFDKLNIDYLIDDTIEEIVEDWQSLSNIDILADMLGIVPYEEEKSIVSEIEKEKTINEIENINDELKLDPKEAKFSIDKENNELEIIESTNGKAVNTNKTYEEVEELIKYDYGLLLEENQVTIPLVVEEKTPETTTSDLENMEIEAIVSSFYTEFDGEKEGRTHNINLASEYFYNLIVEPEEVVSFNEIIDDLRQKDKLRSAPIIVDQEFVDGVGGGLCQVSSTFYNSALKAGLNILERHNHSRPVSYLPLGRDAAVAEKYLDLKV